MTRELLPDTQQDLALLRKRALEYATELSLAEIVHLSWFQHVTAEEVLSREIEAILGFEVEKIGSDYYDNSAEIYGVPEGFVMTQQQQDAVAALGFSRWWTHEDREKSRMPGEKSYFAKKAGVATDIK